jgi:hypothetical protein
MYQLRDALGLRWSASKVQVMRAALGGRGHSRRAPDGGAPEAPDQSWFFDAAGGGLIASWAAWTLVDTNAYSPVLPLYLRVAVPLVVLFGSRGSPWLSTIAAVAAITLTLNGSELGPPRIHWLTLLFALSLCLLGLRRRPRPSSERPSKWILWIIAVVGLVILIALVPSP